MSGGPAAAPPGGRLARLLAGGGFVVTGELVPPRSPDPAPVRRAARRLRGLVDAANVTDNATARVGMSPLAAAALAAAEGLEPVLQLTCRDRNRLALTADLLGAHALGVRAVLCLSGDPMAVGGSDAAPVFDLDAVGLARLATDLARGLGPAGEAIVPPAGLLVGVAEAPGADPSGGGRLAAKVAAGARFVQTQPVYDVAQFAGWLRRVAGRGLLERVAVLAGVLPPPSAAQLERLAGLPGWSVPAATVARVRAARDQRAEGIALAAEVAAAVAELPGVRGVHLMGLGPASGVPEVIEAAGLRPRAAAGS
jgi:methylenetetrahydrofolate reductase (NADPH)